VEAVKRGLTLVQLEALIRHDLAENGYHDGDDAHCYPPELFFHTVDYDKDDCWLVVGDGDSFVTVDRATMVEGAPLESGPFKGKKLCLPVGDEIQMGSTENIDDD